MKTFIKEHGGVVISSLVVVLLIAVCTVIKPLAADANNSIVQKLFEYVSNTLDNSSENDFNDVIGLYKISIKTGLTNNDNGTVNLNIISYFPDAIDIEDGYVVVNGTKTLFSELSYNQVEDGKEYYIPGPNLPAKKFADKYSIEYYDSFGKLIKEATTSVKDHFMQIVNDPGASTELRQYAIDMLNLGAECQTYFNYNTSDLANSELNSNEKNLSDITLESVEQYKMTSSGNTDGITPYGESLIFNTSIVCKIYFKVDNSINNYVFKDGNITLTPTKQSGNVYYVKLPAVSYPNLKTMHNITVVYNGEGDCVVNVNVLSYAYISLRAEARNGTDPKANSMRAVTKVANSAYAISH